MQAYLRFDSHIRSQPELNQTNRTQRRCLRNPLLHRVLSSSSVKKTVTYSYTRDNIRQLAGTLLPACGDGYKKFLMSKVHMMNNANLAYNQPNKKQENIAIPLTPKINAFTVSASISASKPLSDYAPRFKTKLSNANYDDFKIGKLIGQGAYAEVKECIYLPTGAEYAIKIYDKVKLIDTQKKKNVIREIHNIEQLHHRNIIQLYHVIETPNKVMLVLELVKGKSLKSIMRDSPKGMTEYEAARIIEQILSAIEYFHSKNIIHR